MKRLTERFSNGQAAVAGCGNNCKFNYKYCEDNFAENCPTLTEIYEKLASYEELEEKLEKVYGECDGLLETAINSLVRHEGAEIGTPAKTRLLTDEDVDKWESFKDAEEQGLLLRLPVPEGAVVYTLSYIYECKFDYDCKEFDAYKCEEDIPCEHQYKVYRVKETKFQKQMLAMLGKTVFLTKEEAEQALARMVKENGRID